MGIKLSMLDDPDTPTALYRYFDERTLPLYIGITGDLAIREQGHISASRWAELVASSTVTRYPTRRAALEAERAAIKGEQPLFNKQYNDTPAARRRLRAYLEEIGRLDLLDRRKYVNIPLGELEMAERIILRRTVDADRQGGGCEDHAGADCNYRVEVDAALDANGRPVCQGGIVIMHVFDGRECAEVYLSAGEAWKLARAIAGQADESVAPPPACVA